MLKIIEGSAVPVYEQLKRQIKLEIASKRLSVGDRMPSIRDLATRLKINPNTIAKTYRQLEVEGFLQSKAGSGFFIAAGREMREQTSEILLSQLTEEFIAAAIELGASPDFIRVAVDEKLKGKNPDDKSK